MPAAFGFTEAGKISQDDTSDSSTMEAASTLRYTREEHDNHVRVETDREHEVHELVRRFTAQSEQHDTRGSPFSSDIHPRLNPNSEQFCARDWAQAFYNLRYSSEEATPRVAGVAFRGLNVWGKGSPTDFQSTVGNMILKLPSLFGKGTRKIEILRDLDGLLLPGEQLCVLGPPG